MKNFAKIALALGGISAVCAGFAIGTMTSTGKVAKPVNASSTATVSGIRLYVEDQINWTSQNNDAIAHCFSPTFVAGSGYTSLSEISGTGITVGKDYFECAMTWISSSGRHYGFTLPWYIKSMSYCYRNTEGTYVNNNGNKSISTGVETLDYVYSGNNTSYTSQSTSYTISITTYAVAFSDGTNTLSSTSVYENTKFTPMDPAVDWKAKTAGWYTDEAKTVSFENGTKITTDRTLYGTYEVTAASFNSKILAYPNGDIVTADCKTKYETAKSYMNLMSASEKTLFSTDSTYANGYARWLKWKAANNDSSTNPVASVAKSDSSSTLVLGGLAMVAVLAAGSYFFVRKKRVD